MSYRIAFYITAAAGVNRFDGPVQERALRLPLAWNRVKVERVEEEVPLTNDQSSDEELVVRVAGTAGVATEKNGLVIAMTPLDPNAP